MILMVSTFKTLFTVSDRSLDLLLDGLLCFLRVYMQVNQKGIYIEMVLIFFFGSKIIGLVKEVDGQKLCVYLKWE